MSRIGLKPIQIPDGVEVDIQGSFVTVKGPKGTLSRTIVPEITVRKEEKALFVERKSDENQHKALHGLTRTLLSNMVVGVSQGFEKTLEIVGVGYRAAKKGNDVEIQIGFSHPVTVKTKDGISFDTPAPNKIIVKGIDRELVGQIAADIRAIRK
ncbi:MAG: 50S ribosomal protein L6, partial [Candidatus Subteraquimicrobiales bacterium]|nr:50S ribosomal protein L6 [Candidatus Subteraquimicrobiales bacterium]